MTIEKYFQPNRPLDEIDYLTALAKRRGGVLTYVGQLALALPNSKDWPTIIDAKGHVLRADYRGMSDHDLIKAVVWGENAPAKFRIDGAWLMAEIAAGETYEPLDNLEERLDAVQANLYILKNFSHEELLTEFQTRRVLSFLNHESGLSFETTINEVVFNDSKDPVEVFSRIGYGPI